MSENPTGANSRRFITLSRVLVCLISACCAVLESGVVVFFSLLAYSVALFKEETVEKLLRLTLAGL